MQLLSVIIHQCLLEEETVALKNLLTQYARTSVIRTAKRILSKEPHLISIKLWGAGINLRLMMFLQQQECMMDTNLWIKLVIRQSLLRLLWSLIIKFPVTSSISKLSLLKSKIDQFIRQTSTIVEESINLMSDDKIMPQITRKKSIEVILIISNNIPMKWIIKEYI